ncbi:MAG: error-prone DNA polymerase, partial [Rhizobiaceae bacterium]
MTYPIADTCYAELGVTTNFSFLHGGSHPQEFVKAAAEIGFNAIGIVDHNSFAGVVRAHVEAKKIGFRLIVGVRLVLQDGFEVLAYPKNRVAYGRLTKLLTLGNRRAPKGECHLHFEDLPMLENSQLFIVMPPHEPDEVFCEQLVGFTKLFLDQTYLAITPYYCGDDRARYTMLSELAGENGIPLIATNDVLYHFPNRRPLQDVLTCIREHVTIDEAGFRLERNAERHLKSASEMRRLLRGYEDAVARTIDFVRQCTFNLDDLSHNYPDEAMGNGATPFESLKKLTWEGAAKRFPDGVSDKVYKMIEHELAVIEDQKFAPFFLTVYDIVRFARSQKPPILCQGRGSSANSVICFCLGITSVNPEEIDLLFERFVSAKRGEPPDIDVDFEHERREEVIQYVYQKYGRHRAGLTATVIHYRTRSAVNEVGKVMGLSPDVVQFISGMVWGWSAAPPTAEDIRKVGLDPRDKRLRQAMILISQLIGFPRHLSQHVGGFVITQDPLDEVVPIANAAMEDRTVIEWDKDDLDALGMLKVDVLALGMLTCIRKAFDLLRNHYQEDYTLANVPRDDRPTYEMIQRADTVGVFQIESRAQMSMLPRLRPANFYDLVIEIAIVRPGPIQGGMVNPYLRRRQGLEPPTYPSPELEAVLKKTLGVPLFQEQAMKIAMVGAGFSAEKADGLRKAITGFRHHGTIAKYKEDFISGMLNNGYQPEFVESCFKQIEGFSDYGFPESHSASFAILAYASSWLKCHYPEAFACALLNSQPMGFYSASSIVRDLREHDGIALPVDINHSEWDYMLELLEDSKANTR